MQYTEQRKDVLVEAVHQRISEKLGDPEKRVASIEREQACPVVRAVRRSESRPTQTSDHYCSTESEAEGNSNFGGSSFPNPGSSGFSNSFGNLDDQIWVIDPGDHVTQTVVLIFWEIVLMVESDLTQSPL